MAAINKLKSALHILYVLWYPPGRRPIHLRRAMIYWPPTVYFTKIIITCEPEAATSAPDRLRRRVRVERSSGAEGRVGKVTGPYKVRSNLRDRILASYL